MEKTKLLVIVITTAAIIAAATTTSLSAATPAFARVNCNADFSVCTGGADAQTQQTCEFQTICRGGSGGRTTLEPVPGGEQTFSGGGGGQAGPFAGGEVLVGGGGGHSVCDFGTPTCSLDVGGSGQHVK
jgi:hypothetical protein